MPNESNSNCEGVVVSAWQPHHLRRNLRPISHGTRKQIQNSYNMCNLLTSRLPYEATWLTRVNITVVFTSRLRAHICYSGIPEMLFEITAILDEQTINA